MNENDSPGKPPAPNKDYLPSSEEQRAGLYSDYAVRLGGWEAEIIQHQRRMNIARDYERRRTHKLKM